MGTLSFEYKKIDHGVEIEKYIGSESIVDVPSRIGGEPVIKIKAGAFAESKNIQRIDLPFSMKEFSLDALVGCVGLKKFLGTTGGFFSTATPSRLIMTRIFTCRRRC